MRELILFLDDEPNRAALAYQRMPKEDRDATVWVSNAQDCITALRDDAPRLKRVYLDHDLGGHKNVHPGNENSGMEVVRFLEKQPASKYDGCLFIVHSWNPYCGPRMAERLTAAGYKVIYQPFGL